MHVAHLTPAYFSSDSYVGGGERYVDYIVQALRAAGGFEQCIFSLGKEDRLLLRDGTPVRVLRNESPSSEPVFGYSSAMWRELRGFDLVHLHHSLTVFGAYSLALVRSMGIPIVGTDLGGGERDLMLRGRSIELLDGIVSISQFAYSLLGTSFKGPHEVIIGPVNTESFSPATDPVRDRRRVLCVSRIMPHKGIDRIIKVLPPELSLTIVGRVYHEEYYGILQNLAVGKNVTFVIDADDDTLLTLYRTSGLFVQASTAMDIFGNPHAKAELMGLTTLEAMACGLPVVVSETGSLPELIADPRFGRVFHNPAELTNIFREFVAGAWPEADADVLAREHVTRAHGLEAIGRRLASFYGTVMGEHAKSRHVCASYS
jgi:glycosyltransferase involved in cell wall biosynthesis